MCERKVMLFFCLVVFCIIPKTSFSKDNGHSERPATNAQGDALLHVEGYFRTCMDEPEVFVNVDGQWVKVEDNLPGKGNYYLDDQFISYGMCDVVACVSITDPLIVRLVERKKVGEKEPPEGGFSGPQLVSIFKTFPLQGKVRVNVAYFDDQECQNQHNKTIYVGDRE